MPVRRHPIASPRPDATLTLIPLDIALTTRLRATYGRIRERQLPLAEVFYTRLFAAAPRLRSMFPDDLSVQASKLTAALDAVVGTLERPEENARLLGDLGRRHAAYGARPEHYQLVTETLLHAMKQVLGSELSDREAGEWRTALRLIAEQMIAAAESIAPSP